MVNDYIKTKVEFLEYMVRGCRFKTNQVYVKTNKGAYYFNLLAPERDEHGVRTGFYLWRKKTKGELIKRIKEIYKDGVLDVKIDVGL